MSKEQEKMSKNILDTDSTLQLIVRDVRDKKTSKYYTETDEKKQLSNVFNTLLTVFLTVFLFKGQMSKAMVSLMICFSILSEATCNPVYDKGKKCLRLLPPLPDDCWEHFDDARNCPPIGIDADEITALTLKCCKDFPGTVIHCSKPECESPDNHAPLILACFKSTIIKSGYFMTITSSSGFPVISQETCSEGSFEPDDRNSSEANYPYCTFIKTTCRAEGQTRACDGGTSRDNQCGCLADFINICERTFTENHAACKCTRNVCPAGFTRNAYVHDPNQPCPEQYLPVNNSCSQAQIQTHETYDPVSLITSLLTTEATMSSDPVTSAEAEFYPPNADDVAQNDTGKIIGLTLGICVPIIIICIVIILIIICRNMYKQKKNVNITEVRYTEIRESHKYVQKLHDQTMKTESIIK